MKDNTPHKITKTEEQWKKELTNEEYSVLRKQGTETPFMGEYNMVFEDGTYCCKGCGNKLFESNTKFDSGCGWPSFDASIKGNIRYKEDHSLPGRSRTEILCKNCACHIGHVFEDGPTPTKMRYCVNSIAINLIK